MKYYHEPNDEIKSKLHESIVNDSIPFYFDRFEKIVSENGGYFVNGKVCIYYVYQYHIKYILYFNYPKFLIIIIIYYSALNFIIIDISKKQIILSYY